MFLYVGKTNRRCENLGSSRYLKKVEGPWDKQWIDGVASLGRKSAEYFSTFNSDIECSCFLSFRHGDFTTQQLFVSVAPCNVAITKTYSKDKTISFPGHTTKCWFII